MTRPSAARNRRGDHRRGFTLVEMVVAVAVFLLVTGTATGMFVTFSRGQRASAGEATVIGELQAFFELLEREVRTGYGFTFRCEAGEDRGTGQTRACARLVFSNQSKEEITYSLDGTAIRRNVAPITSREIAVRALEFVVTTAGPEDGNPAPPVFDGPQGRVTVRVVACPPAINDARCIRVQTTLTSRQYAPLR